MGKRTIESNGIHWTILSKHLGPWRWRVTVRNDARIEAWQVDGFRTNQQALRAGESFVRQGLWDRTYVQPPPPSESGAYSGTPGPITMTTQQQGTPTDQAPTNSTTNQPTTTDSSTPADSSSAQQTDH